MSNARPVRIKANRQALTIDVLFDDGAGAVYAIGTAPRFAVRLTSGQLEVSEWAEKRVWVPLSLETWRIGNRLISEERARALVEKATAALVTNNTNNHTHAVVEFSIVEQFDEELRQLEARRVS